MFKYGLSLKEKEDFVVMEIHLFMHLKVKVDGRFVMKVTEMQSKNNLMLLPQNLQLCILLV